MQRVMTMFTVLAISVAMTISASAKTIVSGTFSLGYGFSSNSVWDTTETAGANTGVTGDFTVDVTPSGSKFSGYGPQFLGRVLTDGDGTIHLSGGSDDFEVSVVATYTGALPVTNTQLVIDSIRIYGVAYSLTEGDGNLKWQETTVWNTGVSPNVHLASVAIANFRYASSYTPVTWNPADVFIAGSTAARTFALNSDNVRVVDAFEITGHIECTTVPDADVVSDLFSLGYGFSGNLAWDTTETAGANRGVTGDFTVDVTPSGSALSSYGPQFPGRVLTDGEGTTYKSGSSASFGVSVVATYTGTLPVTNTQLVIQRIQIYGADFSTAPPGDGNLKWQETTVWNTGTSSNVPLSIVALGSLQNASSYTPVTWNPDDVAVTGTTATRTFVLSSDNGRAVDGFEITGFIWCKRRPMGTVITLR